MRSLSPLHYDVFVVAGATVVVVALLFAFVTIDLLPFDKMFAAVLGDLLMCLWMSRAARKLQAERARYDERMWLWAFLAFFSVQIPGTLASLKYLDYAIAQDEVPKTGMPSTVGQPALIYLIWFSLSIWAGARVLCKRHQSKRGLPNDFLDQLRLVADRPRR